MAEMATNRHFEKVSSKVDVLPIRMYSDSPRGNWHERDTEIGRQNGLGQCRPGR